MLELEPIVLRDQMQSTLSISMKTSSPLTNVCLASPRTGIPDGLHADDYGRIWTGESEGIVVRNPRGKVIVIFNAETILADQSIPIANFALAGDVLVLLASKRLWTLKLAQKLVSPGRYYTGS
jgi:gluconolactonase